MKARFRRRYNRSILTRGMYYVDSGMHIMFGMNHVHSYDRISPFTVSLGIANVFRGQFWQEVKKQGKI